MIRHMVMFNWKPDTDAEIHDQVRDGFEHMRKTIPCVASMICGSDLGLADGNFDFAMIADFASVDDWQSYRDHPEHVAFVQRFGQHALAATRIQIEI